MRKRKSPALFVAAILFIFGMAVFSYPFLNGILVDLRIRSDAQEFLSWAAADSPIPDPSESHVIVDPKPEDRVPDIYPELWRDMMEYNQEIFRTGQERLNGKSAYEVPCFTLADYGLPDEIFAVLSIPALDIEMPVYLGATSQHMADGAAVMSQTSIPIGGENTNCIIAGHRGWNGAHYFLYINKLKEGDRITVTNLWETLTYQVTQTRVIMPNEVEQIHIQPSRELVTLLSCHPPGTGGRQRYLVICERIDNEPTTESPDRAKAA